MAKVKRMNSMDGELYGYQFKCPGCAWGGHLLPVGEGDGQPRPRWTFNGDLESPTFDPSILGKHEEWQGDLVPPKVHVCHSFVRNGMIQFLDDCTHALAGKTVPLPDITDED